MFTEESLDEEYRWVTREQLVEFHKSGGNATILIEAKELPDRPSRYEAFEILDKGIEYMLTDERCRRRKGQTV